MNVAMGIEGVDLSPAQGYDSYPHQGSYGVVSIGSYAYEHEFESTYEPAEIAGGFGKKFKKLGKKLSKPLKKLEKMARPFVPMALGAAGAFFGGPLGAQLGGMLGSGFGGGSGSNSSGNAESGGYGDLIPGVMPGPNMFPGVMTGGDYGSVPTAGNSPVRRRTEVDVKMVSLVALGGVALYFMMRKK